MPRQAKLRVKNGHYYTAAGSGRYFGRKGEVSYADARDAFAAYLNSLTTERKAARSGEVSTAELVETFLDAVEAKRSGRVYGERKLHLDRFVNYRRGASIIGDVPAATVEAADLEGFLAHVQKAHK